jgi:hypothetical protein
MAARSNARWPVGWGVTTSTPPLQIKPCVGTCANAVMPPLGGARSTDRRLAFRRVTSGLSSAFQPRRRRRHMTRSD